MHAHESSGPSFLTRRRFVGATLSATLLASLRPPAQLGAAESNPRSNLFGDDLPAIEREPGPLQLTPYPGDGQTVGIDPPPFRWPPQPQARGHRLEIRAGSGRGAPYLSSEIVPWTVFAAGHPFPPGEYSWRVIYLDGEGREIGVSSTRNFTVPSDAPRLPVPDVAAIKSRVGSQRPRLFLTATRVDEIRQAVAAGSVPWWEPFLEAANDAAGADCIPEPAPFDLSAPRIQEMRRVYSAARIASAHLARTALAYRITGENKYLQAARRWMACVAKWDPAAITSHRVRQKDGTTGVTEASMAILDRMVLAWDWIGSELDEGERAAVFASLRERGNQVLRLLHSLDFVSRPYPNHEGRVLSFLGKGALAFLGDLPEADGWLEYVMRCYFTSYPDVWGGDEGGYALGVGYWSIYMYHYTGFADALRLVTGIDLYRRPFARATGYFPIYFQPAYAPRGAFGDVGGASSVQGGDRPATIEQKIALERLADALDNPIFRWQAHSIELPSPSRAVSRWHEWLIEDVYSILRAKPAAARGSVRSPAGLEGSRCYHDIGWAAMHSALGDAANDVYVLFKSSRFGSYGHCHADQNTFQFTAYGRALLIDSGYYDWFSSPHHNYWGRQTIAHNGILVNGRGQPARTWEAGGKIESYEQVGAITIVRGQAGPAYNLPQGEGLAREWLRYVKALVPPMEPEVETFERTLAFVASPTRPVLVVHDYLRVGSATNFDWLLHALNAMEYDDKAGSVAVRDGEARLSLRLACSQPYGFSQTDQFTVPPDVDLSAAGFEASAGKSKMYPNQWHLSARTTVPSREIRFFAIMVPYRTGEARPEIEWLRAGENLGFRVDGTEVAAWWGAGEQGRISLAGLQGFGRLAIKSEVKGESMERVSP